MIRRTRFFALLICGLSLGIASAAAPPPGPQDRCAVCGMFVAPFPQWVASFTLADGSRLYFDGPKDLFNCFFDLGRYRPGRGPADVVEVQVTDYYTSAPVNAREAFFVSGSDVLGPMGQELVPVRGRREAETFRRDHGGKLLVFDGTELRDAPPQP